MKKKILSLLLLCGWITCLGIGQALGAGDARAVVDGRNADRVHLREGPSTESKSLGLYFTGTEVLCQSAPAGEWVRVTIGSQSGYMKGEFLSFGSALGAVTPRQPAGIVNKPGWDRADVRQSPSPDAFVLATLGNGDTVTILGETHTRWYYVQAGDQYGYVLSDHVLRVASVPGDNPPRFTPAPGPAQANVSVRYEPLKRRYYTKAGNYLELDLVLPKLTGAAKGIGEINDFFAAKEQFFYNELPFDVAAEAEANGQSVRGAESGYYRSACYTLSAVLGDIVSFSANLDGGAGGVSWAGIEGNTFHLQTGKRLDLSDIFKTSRDHYMNVIYEHISMKITDDINDARRKGNGNPYFFDSAYSGQGYESIRTLNPEDFYLTPDALAVFYPKYALAEGAAGPLVFEIPFASIRDILGN